MKLLCLEDTLEIWDSLNQTVMKFQKNWDFIQRIVQNEIKFHNVFLALQPESGAWLQEIPFPGLQSRYSCFCCIAFRLFNLFNLSTVPTLVSVEQLLMKRIGMV